METSYLQLILNTEGVSGWPSIDLCIPSWLLPTFRLPQMMPPEHIEQMKWWCCNSPNRVHNDYLQNFHECPTNS